MPRRMQALREFRREYFHALRNGLTQEEASQQALDRVKASVHLEFKDEHIDNFTRQERWGEILEVLVEWQIMLRDMPIDRSKIPASPAPADKLLP